MDWWVDEVEGREGSSCEGSFCETRTQSPSAKPWERHLCLEATKCVFWSRQTSGGILPLPWANTLDFLSFQNCELKLVMFVSHGYYKGEITWTFTLFCLNCEWELCVKIWLCPLGSSLLVLDGNDMPFLLLLLTTDPHHPAQSPWQSFFCTHISNSGLSFCNPNQSSYAVYWIVTSISKPKHCGFHVVYHLPFFKFVKHFFFLCSVEVSDLNPWIPSEVINGVTGYFMTHIYSLLVIAKIQKALKMEIV